MVLPIMPCGDIEGLNQQAHDHRVPRDHVIQIAVRVCRCLEFTYGQSIVHRNLNPGNVRLTQDSTAKIGDFGLAVTLDRSRLTQASMMVGTAGYMPPVLRLFEKEPQKRLVSYRVAEGPQGPEFVASDPTPGDGLRRYVGTVCTGSAGPGPGGRGGALAALAGASPCGEGLNRR